MLSQEIVAVIHPAGQDVMISISYSATDLALVSFDLRSRRLTWTCMQKRVLLRTRQSLLLEM